MRYIAQVVKLIVAGVALSIMAAAQSGTSAITGTVKDTAEAVLPSASVRITDLQTGTTQDTVANEAGIFRVGSLVPGSYRVEVEANGFQKLVRGPITVQVGQVVALDLVLQLGQVSETMTVTEAAPLTESQSSTVGQVINQQ